MHQNPGTNLYGGIEEHGKLQERWEKLICMPTQRYDVPSVWIREIFVGIISVDLNRIRNRHWNTERAIFFRQLFCSMLVGCPA